MFIHLSKSSSLNVSVLPLTKIPAEFTKMSSRPSKEIEMTGWLLKIATKSSRCPKLDGYAIANFGVRVERKVVKMIHYGWYNGIVE